MKPSRQFKNIGGAVFLVCSLGLGTAYIYKKNSCPTGYIQVPGSPALGTPTFCAMQFEAQKSEKPTCNGSYCPVSKEKGLPWNFASVIDGQQACSSLGKDYSLMSESQWMTLAHNIVSTPINDIDSVDGLQLAGGNNDKLRQVLTAPSDTKVMKCSVSLSLAHPDNEQCSLRTQGYAGTQQSFQEPYQPGQPNKSQNRTFMLSNGSVIWDLAGNLWEWTDHPFISESKTGTGATFEEDSDGLTGNGIHAVTPVPITRWIEYGEIKTYGNLPQAKPLTESLSSHNGIGKISVNPGWSWDDASNYSTPFKAIGRGGAWGNNENAGIYSLNLALGPSYQRNYTGFRCVKSL